jgi:hypothetical protein
MEIVNGIPCFNCTDVERAKKAPPGDASALNRNDFSDVLQRVREFARANEPLFAGERGRSVNLGV